MRRVISYVGRYEPYGVEKFWIEYVYHKANVLHLTPFKKEQLIEKFFDRVVEAKKNPECISLGNYKFAQVVYVEEVKIPIGYRKYASKEPEPETRNHRFAVLSNGDIAADAMSGSQAFRYYETEGRSLLSYDACDTQFYVCNRGGRFIYWHKNFMRKVEELRKLRELLTDEIEILVESNRYASEVPAIVLERGWISWLKKKLSYAIVELTGDSKDNYMLLSLKDEDPSVRELVANVKKDIPSPYTLLKPEIVLIDVIVDRYVEWAIFKGLSIKGILDMSISSLIKEFWDNVEKKAVSLRDEVLQRYGFEEAANMEYNPHYRDMMSPYTYIDDTKQAERGWLKTFEGNTVYISKSGKVYIDGDYICIVGEKSEESMPRGDKVALRVIALGTNLRYDIYTLKPYYGLLERMFASEQTKGGVHHE